MPLETPGRTRWWHAKEGDEAKVICTLCPRECHIPTGSRGFCFVRANVDGKLVLTTYGRSSGFCIDPIEKKPLNHFLPGTPVLSFGTAGCNLGCKFCQNWDISKSRQMDRVAAEATPQAIIDAAERSGCRSVAFTYNDPVIWAEYAIDIARVARQRGIKTVAVTAGYITPEARTEFYQWMDAANVDLKAFTETFYRKLTQTQLEPVLDTLRYLKHETDIWFEITNLMIPGQNDSPQETERMCDWIVDNLGDRVPVHFTAFHPDFKMMDTARTPHDTLCRAREQALRAGIRYAYVGNVNDVERQSTYCAGCGTLVIERDWYELGRYGLQGNRCKQCGAEIPGVFEADHGNWGRKRLPIRIEDAGASGVTVSANMATKRKPQSTRTAKVVKSACPKSEPDATADAPGPIKTSFTATESDTLATYVRSVIDQTVRGEPVDAILPEALRDTPAYGAFVTLKRATLLRGCRGRWAGASGETDPAMFELGPLLADVAGNTATSDVRFAAIHTRELATLALDISIMFDAGQVDARGMDRAGAIEVGRHGLVISHPKGRGLLLPQVATESGWDAPTFLDQLCRKAGLPPESWQTDEAELMTFRATVLEQAAPEAELDARALDAASLAALIKVANAVLHDRAMRLTPEEALTSRCDQELGIHLQSSGGLTAVALSAGKSILELTQMAARSLKEVGARKNATSQMVANLSILWQPVRLRAQDYPQRHRSLVNSAILAEDGHGEWALVLPRPTGQPDKVNEALRSVKLSAPQWSATDARLTAFSVHRVEAQREQSSPGAVETRSSARAGQFYPAKVAAMTDAIKRHMAAESADKATAMSACRAIMLPHAGWLYCGDTIGKTLRHVTVPRTVIVIGPKHTPHGASWSVPPHKRWDIPGGGIPIATDLAGQILKAVPDFKCEADAHRSEHGTEVLLPFLHQMNPQLRVLPLVIGGTNGFKQLEPLGDALAAICSASEEPVLLVISSDLNHFAKEAENRRLDHLALDAMLNGDARHLHDVVTQNRISMCGMGPAVAVMLALARLGNVEPPQLVDYTNSGAVTGDTSSVVGYAGVLLP